MKQEINESEKFLTEEEIIEIFKKRAEPNNFYSRIFEYKTDLFEKLAAKRFKSENELISFIIENK